MTKSNHNQWNEIYKKSEKYEYYDLLKPHSDMGKILSSFKKNKINKVLDLGCGMGRNLFFLSGNGFDVSGMDLSKKGISFIRKNFKSLMKNAKNPELKVGDVFSRLPYTDNSFDAVISVQVLQHSYEKKIKSAINEIKRIVKPGGLIFITVCGRISKGKVRYCLVKTAKKVSNRTYIPTCGDEKGLVHFIYDKSTILKHYSGFSKLDLWKDDKDYYCLLAKNIKK